MYMYVYIDIKKGMRERMKEGDGEGRWHPLLHFDIIYYVSTYKPKKVMI